MNSLHKKVQVVTVHNKKRTLLLLEMKADRNFGWQNVTGSVDEDEDIDAAALRELREETGIENAKLKKLDIEFKFHDRWGKDVVEYCYLAMTDENKIRISQEEHQDYKWIPLSEIKRNNFKYESNFKAFQKALSCLS